MSKLLPLASLSREIERLRRRGAERIVLAHGAFDLLHIGHLKHLESARRQGTRLVVTVTADRFVNKGPDRPVFPALVRAEMLAALECVDYVAVSEEPTSIAILEILKPDVYVKGSEYQNEAADITGNITREREAVERGGGRIYFTDDITFSSSNLINRHLIQREPEVAAFLDAVRTPSLIGDLQSLIDNALGLKVLVIGETIIDQYDYVMPLGKPPKESIIAARHESQEIFSGGVIAAANHVASFVERVDVVTLVGDDGYGALIAKAAKPNVVLHVHERRGKPTTRKVRFVEAAFTRKLFEIYHMNDEPSGAEEETHLIEAIEQRIDQSDLVLITDFGHGLITPAVIRLVSERAKFLAINTQTNSANAGFNLISKYSRADYICIDAPEARLATRDKHGDIDRIVSEKLPALVECPQIVVTHGRSGCVAYSPLQGLTRVPALANSVVDTIGAGDAFLAVTAPLLAAGGRLDHVAFLGNAAGAIKVGILGHRAAVERIALIRFMTSLLK
jgi:rfaE bifunctional protein kinase chain/domain/rfaE bifunctional protein nucleotidyltransferase chain/domain